MKNLMNNERKITMRTLTGKILVVLGLALLLWNAPGARAADDDQEFTHIARAFRYWFNETTLIETEGMGERGLDDFEKLGAIALHRCCATRPGNG